MVRWDVHTTRRERAEDDVIEMGVWLYPAATGKYNRIYAYSLLMKGGDNRLAPNGTAMRRGSPFKSRCA